MGAKIHKSCPLKGLCRNDIPYTLAAPQKFRNLKCFCKAPTPALHLPVLSLTPVHPLHLHTAFTPEVMAPLTAQPISKYVVVIDARVHSLHYTRIQGALPPHTLHLVAPGEQHKTLATCERIWQFFYDVGLDRKGCVIAIGGGATTDMVGFAAATWKRGVAFALVPTTLLAMVDATIGGKLGVDFGQGKNLVGVFAEPVGTFISSDFLVTLPERELRAGYAEVLKHGLVADAAYWQQCSSGLPAGAGVLETIQRSIAIKSEIVEKDPAEQGIRKVLNFGHTLGHAYESALLGTPNELLHGEAVGLGMALEAQLSVQHAGLAQHQADEVVNTLRKLDYITQPVSTPWATLAGFLMQDKKNVGDKLNFTLLQTIGHAGYDLQVPLADVQKLLAPHLL